MQDSVQQFTTVRWLFVRIKALPAMFKLPLLLFVSFMFSATASHAESFDHSQWNQLLQSNVTYFEDNTHSRIAYKNVDRKLLKQYLNSIASVNMDQYQSWNDDEQLAFLINVYNAYTVSFILSKYPDIESIKELGSVFSSPWKKKNFPLFGQNVSLDHIEHTLIRGEFSEPRIHVAVVCASKGCPPLQNKAFTAQNLEAMLENAMQGFLRGSENSYSQGVLKVSTIFDWYGDDFASGGSKGEQGVKNYIANYNELFSVSVEQIKNAKLSYHEYDWSLND
ncbi:DUF547 domain-containing protein [Alginatibacterium sediminis]|uniref:DUF547 domain-containing protein n=1 Tax=Alginatibacterium sediminis TaxID=2164068 RepID=A0A420EFV8_9ALTE|nr:DUF547 domain-containing protein [Alginatibacterium sediminis]RKF19558.1 DUF547 domain-containing protein [Alginatibacterium sediminis]